MDSALRCKYRRVGKWGLKLPEISLGLWHNFGGTAPLERSREIVRRAFELGITHFDLANNYGPPYRSAEVGVIRQAVAASVPVDDDPA